MKSLLIIVLASLAISAHASEWKTIAETTSNCGEKIQIFGKEGEKYVKALHNDTEIRLMSKDGSAFTEKSMKTTEYVSGVGEDLKLKFIHPSYVEANPPKIEVENGRNSRCRMKAR